MCVCRVFLFFGGCVFFFFKQKTAYEMRISDWSSDVCSSDLSRWLIRGRGSIYGYSASLAAVDEAWKVPPEVVDDGLEPTMAERASAQVGLISTEIGRASCRERVCQYV